MLNQNEEVLRAWLRLSSAICNERIVPDMSYNESMICNHLYQQQKNCPQQPITATELCMKLQMQKSQMNRTLTEMEKKNLIFRRRSEKDRRQVFVSLNMDNVEIYEKQHKKILEFVEKMLEHIGREHAEEIVKMFHLISDAAEEVWK